MSKKKALLGASIVLIVLAGIAIPKAQTSKQKASVVLGTAENNSAQLIAQGRQIFRFDTFGDQAFWGDTLQLHRAINTLTRPATRWRWA
jgi:hypothetical protein